MELPSKGVTPPTPGPSQPRLSPLYPEDPGSITHLGVGEGLLEEGGQPGEENEEGAG